MREFRVWTGEFMVYPQRRYNLDLVFNKIGEWSLWDTSRQPHELISERWRGKLMEYTGLRDKGGQQIYEGDILQYETKRAAETQTFEVKIGYYNNGLGYEDDVSGFGVYGNPLKRIQEGVEQNFDESWLIDGNDFDYGVVVGNIYENHELQQIRDD